MCGCKRKASMLVKNWQGQWRCPEHNEPRQPQDFVRGVPDNQSVPWQQPPRSTYTSFCSFNGQSSIPGLAIPGCEIPGRSMYSPEDEPVAVITACMIFGFSSVPGWMTPGCAIPGESILYDENVPYPPPPPVFYTPWTADSTTVTADSTIYTADGGTI
jgi:hypothetical protein